VGNLPTSIHISNIINKTNSQDLKLNTPIATAIEKILMPLSRLIIAKGISYSQVTEILKKTLLREAQVKGEEGNEQFSDSRISITTGLHRKDIRRLKTEVTTNNSSNNLSITSQVIAKWMADLKTKGSKVPKPLRRKKIKSNELDFEELVSLISKDVRPKVVMDELIDRGIISKDDNDFLFLHPEKLTLNQDEASLANYLGMNVHDHLAVAVNNLINPNQSQLERSVHYHGLSEKAIKKLQEIATEKAMEALVAINNEAQKLIKDPKNYGSKRMNCGMYFFSS